MGSISSTNFRGGLRTRMSGGSDGVPTLGMLNLGALWHPQTGPSNPYRQGGTIYTPPEVSAHDRWVQEQQDEQLAAETAAIAGRAPTKNVTVGMQSFDTMDPMAMTGAQRRAFEPANATYQPNTTDAYKALLEGNEYSDDERRRRAALGVGPGGR